MRALVLIALAGCFNPSPQPGQSCTDWCPPPEQCVAKVCRMIDEETRPNYAFVTDDERQISAQQSMSALDAWCNDRAQRNMLAGEYVAWFSTDTSVSARFSALNARGWIRPDGKPFADTVEDILAGRMHYPLRISDAGTDLGPADGLVATGTDERGNRVEGGTCNNLNPPLGTAAVTIGKADAGSVSWTVAGGTACTISAHIYCFGTDRANPLPKASVPTGAKRAFITRNAYPIKSPGDATLLCRNEGGPAFVALVATPEQSVFEQFTGVTGPWYRADGVIVTEDMSTLTAPIELTFEGDRMGTDVWFGANSLRERLILNYACGDWGTATPPITEAKTGRSERSIGGAPFATNMGNCGGQYHFYCAER